MKIPKKILLGKSKGRIVTYLINLSKGFFFVMDKFPTEPPFWRASYLKQKNDFFSILGRGGQKIDFAHVLHLNPVKSSILLARVETRSTLEENMIAGTHRSTIKLYITCFCIFK